MKYIGNTKNIINWDKILKDLEITDPAHTGPDNSLADPSFVESFKEILSKWNKVEIKTTSEGGTNNWDMYLPEISFDKEIVDKFGNYVNADSLFTWISNIHPGCMSHWHWDASNKESMFETIPNLVRYCCFIMHPQPGHVFMVEDRAFSNSGQGDVWQWDDRKLWHGGVNYGFTEKYMFHFIGKKRQ
jgi:hypothetical protein